MRIQRSPGRTLTISNRSILLETKERKMISNLNLKIDHVTIAGSSLKKLEDEFGKRLGMKPDYGGLIPMGLLICPCLALKMARTSSSFLLLDLDSHRSGQNSLLMTAAPAPGQ